MRSNISEDIAAYIIGEADPRTVQRIETDIEDVDSEVRKSFEAIRRKVLGVDPLPGDSAYTIKTEFKDDDWSDENPDEANLLPRATGSEVRLRPHLLKRAAPWVAALAACLIAAFILSKAGGETLIASATPVTLAGRGGGDSLGLEVHSNGSGFVTVVSLGRGRGPAVRPLPGGDDIPIRPGVPAGLGPLPQDTASVVFAVTEKPASEAISAELDGRPSSPDQFTELASLLEARLKALGFRRAAVGSRTITATPRRPGER